MRSLVALFVSIAFSLPVFAAGIETDRPSRTDSPLTIPKGLTQVEFEAVSFTHSRSKADQLSIGQFVARYGLSDHSDLQVQFSPYIDEWPGGGKDPEDSGIGDTLLRVKMNLMGDRSDADGIALLPYIKIPTAHDSNGKIEGGLLVPMQLQLNQDTELDVEFGASAIRTEDNSDETVQFVSSYALAQKFGEKLQAYVEFYTESSPQADWIATADSGVSYQLSDNEQVDAGVNIGASPAADPYNPFVGYSVRF